MPITVTVIISDETLSENDNQVVKDLGFAMGIDDPVNQPLSEIEDALTAWTKRRIEAERNRGAELRLSSQLTNNRLFS